MSSVRITLVRHGHAAAGWTEGTDPGLSDEGRQQAQRLVDELAGAPPTFLVSPLRRTRETAEVLARHWGVEARVEPAVSEIPAPTDDLDERGRWLDSVLSGTWSEMPPAQQVWREELLDALRRVTTDAVIVTHFVAINTVIGAATDDDRLVCANPGACSRTVVELEGGRFRLINRGAGERLRAR